MYLKLIFQLISVWYFHGHGCLLVYSQSCPELPTTSFPCTTIQSWGNFVNVIQNGSDYLVLCPFNIQKPPTASSLSIEKSVTAVCLTEGECYISASSTEKYGILKLGGLAKLSMHGFVFEAQGSPFDTISAIHIRFETQMKQIFCNCIFNQ